MAEMSSSSFGDAEAWDLSDTSELRLDLDREWSSRQAHFHTLGYRDGIEEGKKSSAQEGFEVGYSEGIKAGRNCGLARGWAGAFVVLPESVQKAFLDDNARMEVGKSQAALSSISSEKGLNLFYSRMTKVNPDARTAVSGENQEDESAVIHNDSLTEKQAANVPVVEKIHLELQSVLRLGGILS